MAHVVTERCVNCRYTDCCTVCPVDCFYEISDPPMLVIDPNTCIDCEACVPECPVQAIWPELELPAEYQEWTAKNAEFFQAGKMIKEKHEPLAGAKSLGEWQEAEKGKGWKITEPSAAGGEEEAAPAEAAPATAATVDEGDVLEAAESGKFKWRSARGIAKELGVVEAAAQSALEKLRDDGKLQQFESKNAKAPAVFSASAQ